MSLSEKLISAMLRTMRGICQFVYGHPVELLRMDPKDGIGRSLAEKIKAKIWLAFSYKFPVDMEDEKKELVLYGVMTHELLHLLRTDFSYANEKMNTYPKSEQRIRHTFANIVEDAAIEYLRSDRLSSFLNDALTASIGFFYKNGEPLGKQETPLGELLNAFIQFGDVGVLNGEFRFEEAKQKYIDCLPLYEQAIVEPVFAKRFELSQKMFELCRPLWEDHQKDLFSGSLISKVLQQAGKSLYETDQHNSSPVEDGKSSPNEASEAANERRKKTIHLINKNQVNEMQGVSQPSRDAGEDADEIYVVVDDDKQEEETGPGLSVPVSGSQDDETAGDNSQYNSSDTDDVDVIDERDEFNDPEGNSGQQNTPSNQSEDVSPIDPSIEQSGSPSSDSSVSKEDLEKNLLRSEPKNSVDTETSTDDVAEDNVTDSVSSNSFKDDNQGTAIKQDLGQELKDLSRQLSDELKSSGDLEISNQLLDEMRSTIDAGLKKEMTDQKVDLKEKRAEEIDLSVESPYYKDVKYINVEVTDQDQYTYTQTFDEHTRRLALNLRANLKQIFTFKGGRKEYRTNGKIDINRYAGKKITARMFCRNVRPDNKADMCIVILVDQSSSMSNCMPRVRQVLALLLEALKGFDVKVKVVGFTTIGAGVTYFHYGNKRWENDSALVKCVMRANANGGTFLGHALRYTGALLKNRTETNRLFICITDGDPEYGRVYKNKSQGIKDCRDAVTEIRKYADVIGVGIYNTEMKEKEYRTVFRDGTVSMSNIDDLVKELPRRLKKILNH